MKRIIKRTTLFIFFTGFVTSLESQINLDSIKKELDRFPNDTSSVIEILKKSDEYKDIDYNVYMAFLDVAEQKAIAISHPLLLSKIFLRKGISYLELSNSVDASNYLLMAKILAEKLEEYDLLISINIELGSLYHMNNEYNKALEYYNQALFMCTNPANPKQLRMKGVILSNIGTIYYRKSKSKKQEIEKAINFTRQSYIIFKAVNDTDNIIGGSCNLCLYFINIQELDSAEYYLEDVRDIIKNDPYNNNFNKVIYYNHKGTLDLAKKNYTQALVSYNLCIDYAKEMAIPRWIFESYHDISIIYEKLGNSTQALKYYKDYINMRDSLMSQENFIKAADIQNKYEKEKKEKELLKINRENEIKAIQILAMNDHKKKLTNYIISLVCLLVLLIALLVLLVNNIRSRKKAYQLLRLKNIKIEEQSIELSRSSRLIAKFQSQMNPHFVFNALHNVQGLILEKKNVKATSQIQRLAKLMRTTYNNAEKDYIPIDEEISYLKTYFKFESNVVNKEIKFDIIVEKGLEETLIPPMLIQPFIENAIKHAELNSVMNPYIKVHLTNENELLCVCIEDNGKGMQDKDENPVKSAHSMSVVKSRIELMFEGISFPQSKSVFSVQTRPEIASGTLIKFYLPLHYLF